MSSWKGKRIYYLALSTFFLLCLLSRNINVKADGAENLKNANTAAIEHVEEYEIPAPAPKGILQLGQLFPTATEIYAPQKRDMLAWQDADNIAGVKQTLYEGMKNRLERIDVSAYQIPYENDEFWDIFSQVFYENGDLFHVYWSGKASVNDYYVLSVAIQYHSHYTAEDQENFYAVVDQILDSMPDGMDQEQKALYLHDYIVTHCQYDVPTLKNNYDSKLEKGKYNAYNVLVEHSAVCQGYALAYAYLCKRAGLEVYLVTSDDNNHAWNLVVIDGIYYFVDCTWDDPVDVYNEKYSSESYCKHVNFLRSRDGMVSTNHKGTNQDWTCDSLGNVYGYAVSSTKYDSYYWNDVTTPIAVIDNTFAYAHSGDSSNVCLRVKGQDETKIALNKRAVWYVWGSTSSYWPGFYGGFVAVGDEFYFNTQDAIYKMSTEGSMEQYYALSGEEKEIGFIYGLLAEGNQLRYSIGTDSMQNSFTIKTLAVELPESPNISDDQLKFSGAALTLEDNLAIRFNVNASVIASCGVTDPYVVFEFNGKETTVSDYINDGTGKYGFVLHNIAPQQMNDVVTATIYGKKDGAVVHGMTATYSVAQYCYKKLNGMTDANHGEIGTLLVDLLNYGEAAQIKMKYRTDALVTANLTNAQKGWATQTDGTFTSCSNPAYETIASPSVSWKGAGLFLEETVAIRYRFMADDYSGLTIKVTDESGHTWTYDMNSPEVKVAEGGGYYLYFNGLNAAQMREKVFAVAYRNSVAVSNTVCYSVESYVASKTGSSDTEMVALIKNMMKYGDAAYAYVN